MSVHSYTPVLPIETSVAQSQVFSCGILLQPVLSLELEKLIGYLNLVSGSFQVHGPCDYVSSVSQFSRSIAAFNLTPTPRGREQ